MLYRYVNRTVLVIYVTAFRKNTPTTITLAKTKL